LYLNINTEKLALPTSLASSNKITRLLVSRQWELLVYTGRKLLIVQLKRRDVEPIVAAILRCFREMQGGWQSSSSAGMQDEYVD
jgi:hypothetical protein